MRLPSAGVSLGDNPGVTVVIPSKDRPDLLPRAVTSALSQTFADVEVVVVDDGSQRRVSVQPDPRVRVLRLPTNRETLPHATQGSRPLAVVG